MMAGFEVVSMWALVSCPCDTTHCDEGPQYTLANAIVPAGREQNKRMSLCSIVLNYDDWLAIASYM